MEQWDGSSWTEVAEIATPRQMGGATWTSGTNSLFAGGYGPGGVLTATEEWSIAGATKTLTVS